MSVEQEPAPTSARSVLNHGCKRGTRQLCRGQSVLAKHCGRLRGLELFQNEAALVTVLGEHVAGWQL